MPRTRSARTADDIGAVNRQQMRRRRTISSASSLPNVKELRSAIVNQAQAHIRNCRATTYAQTQRRSPSPTSYEGSSQATAEPNPQRQILARTRTRPTREWWSVLAIKSTSTTTFVNQWTQSCTFCNIQLLRTESNGWCCNKGKYTLPALPAYPANLLAVFQEEDPSLSACSRKLNNLFCFSIHGLTGGFRHLPALSNVAIMGRVYHQLLDASHGQHSIRWFLYDENMRTSHAHTQGVSTVLVDTFRNLLERERTLSFDTFGLQSMD